MTQTLTIAGFRLHLVYRGNPTVAPAQACYARFLDRPSQATDRAVTVTLGPRGHPLSGLPRPLMDTGTAWSVHRGQGGLIFRLAPPGQREDPLWEAACDEDFTRIQITYSTRLRAWVQGGWRVSNLFQYPLDQLLLIHLLGLNQGLLVHAAGMSLAGQGIVLAGPSGAGKSTLTRALAGLSDIRPINDDRMALRREPSGWSAWGTPWPGDAGIAEYARVPLSRVLFLARGDVSRVRPLSREEALMRLLQVSSIPWYDARLMDTALKTCERLLAEVPCHVLAFRPGRDVAGVLRRVLGV